MRVTVDRPERDQAVRERDEAIINLALEMGAQPAEGSCEPWPPSPEIARRFIVEAPARWQQASARADDERRAARERADRLAAALERLKAEAEAQDLWALAEIAGDALGGLR